jgi:hypothetical protein
VSAPQHPRPGDPGHPADGGGPGAPEQDWDAVPPGAPQSVAWGRPAPWGQPPYGGQPAYGVPAVGGGTYLQPPQYGPPGSPPPWPQYPAPPYPAPARPRTGLLWGLVAALAATVLVLTAVLFAGGGDSGDSGTAALPLPERPEPVAAPSPTLAYTGLGDDPVLDHLAKQCSDGQMNPCDDLFDESFPGSDYEDFADTCAGRRPPGEDTYCADVFYDA